MTIVDAYISYFLTRAIVSVLLLFVFWKFVKPNMKSYYEYIFAYLINRFAEKLNKKLDHQKKNLFQSLPNLQKGKELLILEIGIGGGANFKYYPAKTSVIAVDPNPQFKKHITANVKQYKGITVKELVVAKTEDLGQMPENYVDAVVSTLVLCSVDEIALSIRLIKRVLRPGGKLYYIEHVADEKGSIRYLLQQFITPLLRQVSCELTRRTGDIIKNAGFSQVEQTKFTAPLGRMSWVIQPLLIGEATK